MQNYFRKVIIEFILILFITSIPTQAQNVQKQVQKEVSDKLKLETIQSTILIKAPIEVQITDEVYDETYDESYDDSYDETYDESYDETYDDSYDETYDEMNDESYDEAYDDSYDEAYGESYDESYDEVDESSGSILTCLGGVNYFNGHTETWYSEKVLPGEALNIPGRHVDEQGLVKDEDGYICVASSDYSKGTIVETSLGMGKVYDSGCDSGIIDIYTNW